MAYDFGFGPGGGVTDYMQGGSTGWPAAKVANPAGSILSAGLPAIQGAIPNIAAPAAGGAASGILGGLNTALGFLGPVGAIAGTVGTIANMFKRSPEGNAKMDATRSQQNMEQWMKDIEGQVNAGTLDVDTAIQMIQGIAKQSIGQDNYGANTAGQAQVNAMANQIIGNLSAKRNWNLQAGVGTDKDRIMSGSLAAAPSFQKERGATLLRNLAMGTQLGKDFKATGAPMANIFNEAPTSQANFGNTMGQIGSQIQKLSPTPANPNLGSTLKSKLAFYGK